MPDEQIRPIVERALTSDHYGHRRSAIKVIALSEGPAAALRSLLLREEIAIERRQELVNVLPSFVRDEQARLPFLYSFIEDDSLTPFFRDVAATFAARYGSRRHMDTLVDRLAKLEELPLPIATATVSVLGHFRDRDLGDRAAMAVKSRVSSDASDAASFASVAAIGMTSLFEMDIFQSGALRPTTFHLSITAWRELVDMWIDLEPKQEGERLRLLISAHELGVARAAELIEQIVVAIDPDDTKWDREDEYGNTISSALRVIRAARRLLPREVALRFILARRPNVPNDGVEALAAHGDLEALTQRLELYTTIKEWFNRHAVTDAIETLSGQLGVIIMETATGLRVQEP